MVAVAVDTWVGNVRNLGAVGAVSTGGVIVASCTRASMTASRADATGVSAGRANASSSVSASRAETTGVACRADASSTVVGIGVDTWVDSVADTAVGSVSARGVIIARHVATAGVASAAQTSCAGVGAGGANTGVTSAAEASCAGVGTRRADTSGVAGGTNTGRADTSARSAMSAGGASGWAVRGFSCQLMVSVRRWRLTWHVRPGQSQYEGRQRWRLCWSEGRGFPQAAREPCRSAGRP